MTDPQDALSQYQDAWVALATDAALRRRFYATPLEALAPWRPGAEALAALPHEALERYARSLVAKRVHEFERAIPLSLKVAPPLTDWYRAWVPTHPAPPGCHVLDPGVTEGLRALRHLTDRLAEVVDMDGPVATYSADLLAFELHRRASAIDGEVRVIQCDHRADQLAAWLASGALPVDPPRAPVSFRFHGERVQWRAR